MSEIAVLTSDVRWAARVQCALDARGLRSRVVVGETSCNFMRDKRFCLAVCDLGPPGSNASLDPEVWMEIESGVDVLLAVGSFEPEAMAPLLATPALDIVHRDHPVELALRVERALRRRGSTRSGTRDLEPLRASSPRMRSVLETLARVAMGEATVLLAGETGSGKGRLARWIHERSPRRLGPFVAVHCAAVPASLIEDELFGHEEGAFTGALSRRIGRFEAAGGGTLFLDEVGDIPLEVQVKLLRVLEVGEVERLGGREAVPLDVRVVAATHRDLPARVETGAFREDLFYRLNVVPVAVPPLRERPEDVIRLAERFLRSASGALGQKPPRLTSEARAQLLAHPWPGNVRELKNAMARLTTLVDGPWVDVTHLDFLGTGMRAADRRTLAARAIEGAASLHEVEGRLIDLALEDSQGNLTRAARRLGLTRRALRYRMKKHGLIASRSHAGRDAYPTTT